MSKELEERKNDKITRAEEILNLAKAEGRELTDEESKEFMELRDEVNKIKEMIRFENELNEMEIKVEKKEEINHMSNAEIRNSHEYNLAYAEYLKTGNDMECRSLLTDLVSGEVPIATYLEEGIQTAWKKTNIAQLANHVSIKGIIEIPFEYSATAAVVHTEGASAPTEEELTFGEVTIKPETLKKWITVSDTVTALKGEAFLDYIIAEIGQRIAELEDKEAIATIKAAVGSTTTTQPGVASVTESAITFATIFNALAVLADGATNPVAVMNKQTYFSDFMALTDNASRPIYNVVTENGVPSYYINGVKVIFNDALTAHTEIIVGDFSGLMENIPDGGINFIRDPYSLAEKNLIKIVGRKMVGFGVTKENYFALVTISA